MFGSMEPIPPLDSRRLATTQVPCRWRRQRLTRCAFLGPQHLQVADHFFVIRVMMEELVDCHDDAPPIAVKRVHVLGTEGREIRLDRQPIGDKSGFRVLHRPGLV